MDVWGVKAEREYFGRDDAFLPSYFAPDPPIGLHRQALPATQREERLRERKRRCYDTAADGEEKL
jgi:hypothetical protein